MSIIGLILSATRLEGNFDTEGNPTYAIKSHNVVTVKGAPEELRRKVQ